MSVENNNGSHHSSSAMMTVLIVSIILMTRMMTLMMTREPGGAENNNSRNGDHLSSGSVSSGSDESVSVLRNNRSVKILSFQEIQIQHMNKMKETIYIYISYIF